MTRPSYPDVLAKFGVNEPVAGSMVEALSDAADRAPMSIKAIASDCGVRPGYLHEALNPNREDTQFQARLLVPFMRSTGSLAPLRYLSHEMGCVLVPLTPDGSTDEHTSKSLKEFGDYLHSAAAARADNVITKSEVRAVRIQVEEVISALLAHVAGLATRAVEDDTCR